MTQLLINGLDPAVLERERTATKQAEIQREVREEMAYLIDSLLPLVEAQVAGKRTLDRLAGKLRDPALADHPKRPAAEARWARLDLAHELTKAMVDVGLREVGQLWNVLDREAQGTFVVAGYPRPPRFGRGVEFAGMVFMTMVCDAEDRLAGRPVPSRPWKWEPPRFEDVPW